MRTLNATYAIEVSWVLSIHILTFVGLWTAGLYPVAIFGIGTLVFAMLFILAAAYCALRAGRTINRNPGLVAALLVSDATEYRARLSTMNGL
jgi:hypothetical protein